MKDYYARMDLSNSASRREIEAELSSLDEATLRRNARFVLLEPERRATYDQCHRALRQIAFVRARLGLNRAPFWLLSDCADFTTEPFADRRSKKDRRLFRRLFPLLVAFLALAVVFRFFDRRPASAPTEEKQVELSLEVAEPELQNTPVIGESQRPEVDWETWRRVFRAEVAPVETAWGRLTKGLDEESFELADRRCRDLLAVVRQCDRDALMPSPEPHLDSSVHRFLDHLEKAAVACRRQKFFAMTEDLDLAREAWDDIDRRLRFRALEP